MERSVPPRPRVDSARRVLAGSASLAVRALLDGPRRPARVLAAFPSAVYVEAATATEPRVLALVTTDAVRLPISLVVSTSSRHTPLRPARVGEQAVVGDGMVDAAGLRTRVARWWSPLTELEGACPQRLGRSIEALHGMLATAPQRPGLTDRDGPGVVASACLDGDLARAVDAAEQLVGLGPGLTPSGDDMLAGLLLGLRLTGRALPGGERATWLASWIGAAVTADAETRTTSLSAALLRCAARGQATGGTAGVLRALAGHGPLAPAVRRLLATGHTSGADLAWGIYTGCSSAMSGDAG